MVIFHSYVSHYQRLSLLLLINLHVVPAFHSCPRRGGGQLAKEPPRDGLDDDTSRVIEGIDVEVSSNLPGLVN